MVSGVSPFSSIPRVGVPRDQSDPSEYLFILLLTSTNVLLYVHPEGVKYVKDVGIFQLIFSFLFILVTGFF